MIAKAGAFLRRDFTIATSYRAAFAMQLASMAIWVPITYFIGRGVTAGGSGQFENSSGYFEFLLIGLGLLGFLTISLQTFNQSIRESQLMGTLEIVLLSPTSITQLLVFSSLWVYLFMTVRFVLYLALGVIFGLDLGESDFFAATLVLALSISAFASFGIASAALILVIKRGETVNLLLSTGSLVLAGVVYPVSVLPGWMQKVSEFVPLTHSLTAMRGALFEGRGVTDLLPQLGMLALFSFILLPISLGLFWYAVRWTKASGTLSQY